MLDALNLVEGLAQAAESWSGWRYLLSSSYRREIHQSWTEKSDLRIFGEIIYGIFWMAVSLFFAAWCYSYFTGKGLFIY